VLGKFTGEDQANGSLNLARRDGRLLVVGSQLGGLGSDTLEDIIDEGVEDRHSTVGNASVGMDLLQNLVNV